MKKVKEKFYKILINRENFYMKQYYSNFYGKEKFLAIKELEGGIYCVLISDEKNEEIDYSEAISFIKTLGKSFSLNMIILAEQEYIPINYSYVAHKLIINKENYEVISCDESCIPLNQVFKIVLQENEARITHEKQDFLQDKIPTLVIMGMNIIIFIITQAIIYNITNIETNNILSMYSTKISPEEINKKINEMINIVNNSVLISFGAKYNILIEQGQVWRLLTCAFLHSNLVHIAGNMYSLYIIGPQIQQIYGTRKYLFIYIITCITSSLLSYFMSPSSISVGASGGIFGLMGALLAFVIIERHRIQKKSISSLIQIIVINLFIGLSIKNIDNFGHVGGLVGGIVVGYIIYKTSNKKVN